MYVNSRWFSATLWIMEEFNMKLKKIPLLLCLSALSLGANAQDKPSFSVGISSFAVSQDVTYGSGGGELNYGGFQLLGAVSLNDNVQAQVAFYNVSEDDASDLKLSGNTIRMNFGQGFQKEGFKAYGTIGLFNEEIKVPGASEDVSGLEFGAAIGYNFKAVSVDYGFTIRNSSDYEEKYGANDVTTATGSLSLTANF